MKLHQIAAAALLAAAFAPTIAKAQQTPQTMREAVVYTAQSRGMLGIMTEPVRTGAQPSRQRVVSDVVPASPAQRAGLVPGDTILRVNGLPATEHVMGAPFEPGDTVTLTVRRNGAEREVTVVAVSRAGATYRSVVTRGDALLPDTVMQQISIIMSNVREHAGNLSGLPISIERRAGDSTIVMRFADDSVRVLRYEPIAAARLLPDSVLSRFTASARVIGDAPFIMGDSSRVHVLRAGEANFQRDSIHFVRPGEHFVRSGENFVRSGENFVRPSDLVASNVFMGMRSLAGAEVAELNPGLAEYFGVAEGILVLDARESTPAARAGLLPGDVIVQVNGARASSLSDVRRIIMAAGPGGAVQLRVLRRGQPIDLTL
jgi:membrane-associated protease RseP (regulator of RpoE activity)